MVCCNTLIISNISLLSPARLSEISKNTLEVGIAKNPSHFVRGFISGADGARTHDLGRDRPAF